MDTEQIALIGGLVVGGIGAASGLVAPWVARVNARDSWRAQRTDLWLLMLKERLHRLTEIYIDLETSPPEDQAQLRVIIAEITALVYGTGDTTVVKLYTKNIKEEMEKLTDSGTLSIPNMAKKYCEQAFLSIGVALRTWLDLE